MNKKIPVYGMHCRSCELMLENKLGEIPGIKINNISQKNNSIDIDIKNESDFKKVCDIITELGYHTEKKQKISKNSFLDYTIIFLIFILFGLIYIIFKDVKLFDNILKSNNLSFFVIILIGLIASVSSCLAVTGGIVLGFAKYIDTSKNTYSHLKTQINFHIGRILGFAIGGGILGSVGGYLGSFGMLNKFLLLLAGIFMIYMGLNILNILPSITKFGISMPKFLGNKILNIKNPALSPIIGALTFFLPCGFTQSMQVYAASSGSFISGSLIMGAFALGTLPVLFLVGFGSSYFKDKNFNYINKIIGVLVIYFGIFILSGFSNFIHINSKPINQTINNNVNSNLEELKEVTVSHNGDVLVPEEIVLEGAKNYKLIINPTSDGLGCKYALTIPGIDESEHQIKSGIPIVIDIKNPTPGTYNVVCTAMGMRHGVIIIK